MVVLWWRRRPRSISQIASATMPAAEAMKKAGFIAVIRGEGAIAAIAASRTKASTRPRRARGIRKTTAFAAASAAPMTSAIQGLSSRPPPVSANRAPPRTSSTIVFRSRKTSPTKTSRHCELNPNEGILPNRSLYCSLRTAAMKRPWR